ncbi:ricin-type beta-trefoil lectin domain protein [Kitasatospora sp. NPDC058218]|uniref:ricin-type beta-trefoil lectin domain protein n=1 Tax=Kitasatospora sp. NPDC058218 TaxID=3346385 RepID=UPI0036D9FA60
MIQNMATGKCLTATNAGTDFAEVLVFGCDRTNGSQWWGNYGFRLMQMSYSNCLVNRNGQPGTEVCGSSNNGNWMYGSNPSTLSSFAGGYLTTGGYYTWLGAIQGDYTQWKRVY